MTALQPPQTPIETDALPLAAQEVSFEEYMERYAAHFYEWVRGKVIKMTPVSLRHTLLAQYLFQLLSHYLAYRPVGTVLLAPFAMRVKELEIVREPDLQIVLQEHRDRLTETATEGPADLCIEVVSPESVTRDYGQKFEEYEKAGVREYWIVDPHREQAIFYRLSEHGLYAAVAADTEGNYRTPLLPNFALHVPTLWQDPLPNPLQIAEAVRELLGEA